MTPFRRALTATLTLGVLVIAAWPLTPSSRVRVIGEAAVTEARQHSTAARAARAAMNAGVGCSSCHALEVETPANVACRERRLPKPPMSMAD